MIILETANSSSVKLVNTNIVLEKLTELKETSRIELSRLTTLSKATVSSVVKQLIDSGIVIETKKSIKTSGRSAHVIALNKNAGRILSLELLTDSIYGIVSNLYGDILYEHHELAEKPEFNFYIEHLFAAIDKLMKNTRDSKYGVIGIGIGVYGILSKDKKIKFATFASWKDIDLQKIIEDYTGVDTYIENEANISAIGEHTVHEEQDNMISLNIGIGVGMGIIIDNQLYTGENGYAGEIGHNILIPNGRACVCGNHGCLERYISDPAVVESYFIHTGEKITIEEFIQRFKRNDEHAKHIYEEFIAYLGITINNISLTLNPKTIVINSKIIDQIPGSVTAVKKTFQSRMMSLEFLSTSKYKSKKNVIGLTHVLIHNFLNVINKKLTATN